MPTNEHRSAYHRTPLSCFANLEGSLVSRKVGQHKYAVAHRQTEPHFKDYGKIVGRIKANLQRMSCTYEEAVSIMKETNLLRDLNVQTGTLYRPYCGGYGYITSNEMESVTFYRIWDAFAARVYPTPYAEAARRYHTTWSKLHLLNAHRMLREMPEKFLMWLPHASTEVPEMIAYYQNFDKLERGIETRVKAGKFYRMAFPDASDDEIREMANDHIAKYRQESLNLVPSQDEEQWVDVYRNGPDSCMKSRTWAVRAYCRPGNGLYLAYLGTRSEPTARAIVVDNRKQKGYIRIYGNSDQLQRSLAAHGFTDQINMNGIIINRLEYCGDTVCPYIDGDDPWVNEVVIDGEDCLEIVDGYGEYSGQNRNDIGLLEMSHCTCDVCDSRVDEDDTRYIEGHGTVCDSCVDNHFHWSEVESEHIHEDDSVCYIDRGGYESRCSYDYASSNLLRLDEEWDYVDWIHPEYAVNTYSDGVYHPDDDRLVYLHESYGGFQELRDNCIFTEHDSEYILREDAVCIGVDEWAHREDCVELDNPYDGITHRLEDDEEARLADQARATAAA